MSRSRLSREVVCHLFERDRLCHLIELFLDSWNDVAWLSHARAMLRFPSAQSDVTQQAQIAAVSDELSLQQGSDVPHTVVLPAQLSPSEVRARQHLP